MNTVAFCHDCYRITSIEPHDNRHIYFTCRNCHIEQYAYVVGYNTPDFDSYRHAMQNPIKSRYYYDITNCTYHRNCPSCSNHIITPNHLKWSHCMHCDRGVFVEQGSLISIIELYQYTEIRDTRGHVHLISRRSIKDMMEIVVKCKRDHHYMSSGITMHDFVPRYIAAQDNYGLNLERTLYNAAGYYSTREMETQVSDSNRTYVPFDEAMKSFEIDCICGNRHKLSEDCPTKTSEDEVGDMLDEMGL